MEQTDRTNGVCALQNVYVSTPTASPCFLATAAAAAGGGGGGGDGCVADDAGDEPNETAPMLGLHYDVDDQHTRSYSTDRTCFAHAVGLRYITA